MYWWKYWKVHIFSLRTKFEKEKIYYMISPGLLRVQDL